MANSSTLESSNAIDSLHHLHLSTSNDHTNHMLTPAAPTTGPAQITSTSSTPASSSGDPKTAPDSGLMRSLNTSPLIQPSSTSSTAANCESPSRSNAVAGLAFTIDFDSNDSALPITGSARKKLDIRDSIRQFAPPKKSIERTSPRLSNSPTPPPMVDTTPSSHSSPSNAVRMNSSSRKSRPSTDSAAHLSEGACFLIQRMLSSEQQQKSMSPELSSISISSPATKSLSASPVKCSNRNSLTSSKCSPTSRRTSGCGSSQCGSKSSCSMMSRTERDSGVCDSRITVDDDDEDREDDDDDDPEDERTDDELSETGTYTVELDQCDDPAEEAARKRIAQIFGSSGACSASSSSSGSRRNSFGGLSNCDHSLPLQQRPNAFRLGASSNQSFSIGQSQSSRSTSRCASQSPLASTERLNDLTRRLRNTNNGQLGPTHGADQSAAHPKMAVKTTTKAKPNLSNQSSNGPVSLPNGAKSGTGSRRSSISSSVHKPPIGNNSNGATNVNGSVRTQRQTTNITNSVIMGSALRSSSACSQRSAGSGSMANRVVSSKAANQSTSKRILNSKSSSLQTTHRRRLNDRTDSISVRSEDASNSGNSTDLSSIGSERCRTDTSINVAIPPASSSTRIGNASATSNSITTTRYNRTFALRRAHLGLSIDSNDPTRTASPTTARKPAANASNDVQSGRSQASSAFERTDGGRYSLRESKVAPAARANSFTSGVLRTGSTSIGLSRLSIGNNSNGERNSPPPTDLNRSDRSSTTVTIASTNRPSSSHHHRSRSMDNYSESIGSGPCSLPNPIDSSDELDSNERHLRSLQLLSPFQLSRRLFSTKNHFLATAGNHGNMTSARLKSDGEKPSLTDHGPTTTSCLFTCSLTGSYSESRPAMSAHDHALHPKHPPSSPQFVQHSNHPTSLVSSERDVAKSKGLSSLDQLVLSATHQLSFKLRCKLRAMLEHEKSRYSLHSENRILIEELLPQVNAGELRASEDNEKTVSRDLSNVLKNLKRIEQSLDVINLLLESSHDPRSTCSESGISNLKSEYFAVDI